MDQDYTNAIRDENQALISQWEAAGKEQGRILEIVMGNMQRELTEQEKGLILDIPSLAYRHLCWLRIRRYAEQIETKEKPPPPERNLQL